MQGSPGLYQQFCNALPCCRLFDFNLYLSNRLSWAIQSQNFAQQFRLCLYKIFCSDGKCSRQPEQKSCVWRTWGPQASASSLSRENTDNKPQFWQTSPYSWTFGLLTKISWTFRLLTRKRGVLSNTIKAVSCYKRRALQPSVASDMAKWLTSFPEKFKHEALSKHNEFAILLHAYFQVSSIESKQP